MLDTFDLSVTGECQLVQTLQKFTVRQAKLSSDSMLQFLSRFPNFRKLDIRNSKADDPSLMKEQALLRFPDTLVQYEPWPWYR